MVKRSARKTVDRHKFPEYQRVAEHFYEASEVAMEFTYWTAAGVLMVHAAIAYTDAITIKLTGQKSAGENHEDAIALVQDAVADGESKASAMNQLKKIIAEKTRVSYSGDIYDEETIRNLQKSLKRFRDWALKILER